RARDSTSCGSERTLKKLRAPLPAHRACKHQLSTASLEDEERLHAWIDAACAVMMPSCVINIGADGDPNHGLAVCRALRRSDVDGPTQTSGTRVCVALSARLDAQSTAQHVPMNATHGPVQLSVQLGNVENLVNLNGHDVTG